jgi:hypothetical protein
MRMTVVYAPWKGAGRALYLTSTLRKPFLGPAPRQGALFGNRPFPGGFTTG